MLVGKGGDLSEEEVGRVLCFGSGGDCLVFVAP